MERAVGVAESTPRVTSSTNPGELSRVARRRMRRTTDILAVTAEILGEQGYHALNLEEIADRVDLTKATLYHYFESKDELVAATLRFVASDVTQRLEDLASRDQDESATSRLRVLLVEQMRILVSKYPAGGGRLFVEPLDWPPGLAQVIRGLRSDHDRIFRDVIDQGIQAGEFSAVDPNIVRHCIYGALNYVPVWTRRRPKKEVEAICIAVADHLMKLLN